MPVVTRLGRLALAVIVASGGVESASVVVAYRNLQPLGSRTRVVNRVKIVAIIERVIINPLDAVTDSYAGEAEAIASA